MSFHIAPSVSLRHAAIKQASPSVKGALSRRLADRARNGGFFCCQANPPKLRTIRPRGPSRHGRNCRSHLLCRATSRNHPSPVDPISTPSEAHRIRSLCVVPALQFTRTGPRCASGGVGGYCPRVRTNYYYGHQNCSPHTLPYFDGREKLILSRPAQRRSWIAIIEWLLRASRWHQASPQSVPA